MEEPLSEGCEKNFLKPQFCFYKMLFFNVTIQSSGAVLSNRDNLLKVIYNVPSATPLVVRNVVSTPVQHSSRVVCLVIKLSNDIESNPGPPRRLVSGS